MELSWLGRTGEDALHLQLAGDTSARLDIAANRL